MKGFIYISKALATFDAPAIELLAIQASKKNKELEITGCLYFEEDHFIQYIEGEDTAISTLMEKIKADERHEVQETLIDHDVALRRFPSWSMRWIRKPNANIIGMEDILITYMRNKTFITESKWPEYIWRTLDKLSEHQSNYKAMPQD